MMVIILNIIILVFVIPSLMTEEIQKTNKINKKRNLQSRSLEESENFQFPEEEEIVNQDTKYIQSLMRDTVSEKYSGRKTHVNLEKVTKDEALNTDVKMPEYSTVRDIKEEADDKLKYKITLDKDTKPERLLVKVKLYEYHSSIEQKHQKHFKDSSIELKHQSHLDDHTLVTDNELFPFMVAILKGASFLCAGALIGENWVLTAAGKLFLMTESVRFLRVRLGSVNYKKGGTLLSVKYLELHPYFNRSKPNYDLALVMLSAPVRYTPSLRSVRLQVMAQEVSATHFLVSSWSKTAKKKPNSIPYSSLRRILTVTHVHPLDPQDCVEELQDINAGHDGVICFETSLEDACTRDTGAPVVINGVLWAVISSWKPAVCDKKDPPPVFAALVSASNISTWIHEAIHKYKWSPKNI